MEHPSEQCINSISKVDGATVELLAEATPIVEFMRASGIDTATTQASIQDLLGKIKQDPKDTTLENDDFRDAVNDALGDHKTNATTFVNWLELWVNKNGLPGWDNSTCSMSWETYECFCRNSAQAFVSGGNLSEYLGSSKEAECSAEKASILPWVGAGTLALFGLGFFFWKGR